MTWNSLALGSWSVAGNWSGGLPAANDVVFGATGSVNTASTDTSVVDVDTSVNSLAFNQFSLSPAVAYHQVNIQASKTLQVTGFGTTAFTVGTGTDSTNQALVYGAINGAGTLWLNNGTGDLVIRQCSVTSAGQVQRATLDLSGLANFVTNCDDIQIGSGGTTPLIRATGTLYLAQTNNITANTLAVSAQSNTGSGGQSQLYLGSVNNLNISTIEIGEKRANALMQFKSGTGNTLKIRATNGTGRADMNIGAQALSAGNPDSSTNANVNLTNSGGGGSGTVDALLNTLVIGRAGDRRSSGSGTLIFDAGTIDVNDMTVGDSNVSNTSTLTTANGNGIVQVRGTGKLIVNNNLTLGLKQNVLAPNIGASGSLTISGGSVRVGGSLLDGTGTTSLAIDSGGSLQARGLGSATSSIDTMTINNGTIIADLGTSGTPASAWGRVANLTSDGANLINLAFSGDLTAGTFPVLDYDSIAGAGSFALAKLPSRVDATLMPNPGNTSIDLQIIAADVTKWSGATNTTWDINTTNNWKLSNSGLAAKYLEDLVTYSTTDTSIFDDSATGTTTVDVSTTVKPNGVTFNNGTLTYNLVGSGKISGPTGITKNGAGLATIANTGGNDFAGIVSVNAGTLATAANEVLPDTATVAVNGGTFAAGGTETVAQVTIAGGTVTSPAGNLQSSISVTSGAIQSLAGNVTISKGTSSLSASMGGNSTFVGTVTLNNGTVILTSNSGLGDPASPTIIQGGTLNGRLDLSGGITTTEAIEVRGRSNSPVNSTPHISSSAGTNTIDSVLSMTTGGSNYNFSADGGKLIIKGADFSLVSSTRQVNLQGTAEGEVGAAGITLGTGTASVQVIKSGTGTWTLSGANTYLGGTAVQGGVLATASNFSNGTLTIGAGAVARVLPHGTANSAAGETILSDLVIDPAGKLDLTNNRLTFTGAGATLSSIEALVKSAYGAGSWEGNGISSSLATAAAGGTDKTALGVVASSDIGLGGTSSIVKYVYRGDANVDGKVNTLDFNNLAGSFGSSGRWFNGDFDYSGVIDSLDFAALVANYGKSLPTAVPGLGAVVPEPAALPLAALTALSLRRRRR